MRPICCLLLILVGSKLYGGDTPATLFWFLSEANRDFGKVPAVTGPLSEVGVVILPNRPSILSMYKPVMNKDLKTLSRKQILQFIKAVVRAYHENNLPPSEYSARLLDIALADTDAIVRAKAISALGTIGLKTARFYRPLAGILKTPASPPSIRKEVAEYFRKVKPQDPKVNESLVHAMIHDNKHFVRIATVLALGAIQPTDPLIIRKLAYVAWSDKNGGVQQSALSVLNNIAHGRCSTAFER